MTNENFILAHRTEDVKQLALKNFPEGVNRQWCLQQIEGWQLAQKKLPRWAAQDELWFPPRLSMEQCSSELTAEYKRLLAERLLKEEERHSMADLTGGLGIDFSYMAHSFRHATYVECQPHLCELARHNMPLLGLPDAEVICDTSLPADRQVSLIFVDPARRDQAGHKTVAIEDCTPDITTLQDTLLTRTRYIILKLSPMLDVSQALRQLHEVREVHAVSVQGECKEILFVMGKGEGLSLHCANLGTNNDDFFCTEMARTSKSEIAENVGRYIYEPNASILKLGTQDALAVSLGLKKLHPVSNLFTSEELLLSYPGRAFTVERVLDFSKQSVKELTRLGKANLTIRNFPTTVAELRKRLKLKEGGDTYLFATTLSDGKHAILLCKKAPL